MRVISGTARSLKLNTPPGLDVRPTTDRIKETLFNIINNRLYGIDFLDIFAGSGAIGIEALSRGAKYACFVENSKASLSCINQNLDHTHLSSGAEIISGEATASISRLYTMGKRFDIIFMDPPYNKLLEKQIVEQLDKYRLLKEDGLIIVEASKDTDFDYIDDTCFSIVREKSYGSNKHIFLEYK